MPKFFAGLFLKASVIFLLICVCVFRICRFVLVVFGHFFFFNYSEKPEWAFALQTRLLTK